MKFWDASAVVPLCLDQPASPQMKALLQEDSKMIVWWGCTVECWSAFARLRREGVITQDGEDQARTHLETLERSWVEIQPIAEVRSHAGRLVKVHVLRAGDALQLAAALVWTGSLLSGVMVVLDRVLKDAARLEGFSVRP
ncbi:MAG: type II toxin-antitoxin system VapC family toxin [bacterium]